MHLARRPTLQIVSGGDGNVTVATVTLDDGTVIHVEALDGPSPSPSFLVNDINAQGPSLTALTDFRRSTETHDWFKKGWQRYNEFLQEKGEKPISDELRTRIKNAIANDELVLRLEGSPQPSSHDILTIGDTARLSLVFFGLASTTLGKIVDVSVP